MKCQNCKHTQFYQLQNEYIKCKKCGKKYSLKKINKDKTIIDAFCQNKTALEVSKELKLNYKSIKDRYDLFRKLCASYLEELHYSKPADHSSYEEYYYFTKRQKQKKEKSLYEAVNIIGFYSNKLIYTLLMPKLRKTWNEESDKSFEKYLNWRKIDSDRFQNKELKEFWSFLEDNLKKYKGIDYDNFFYYLKESEYKFNFTQDEQKNILEDLYFN